MFGAKKKQQQKNKIEYCITKFVNRYYLSNAFCMHILKWYKKRKCGEREGNR
jgi:hypothetical protein